MTWTIPTYVRDGSFYGKSFEIEGPLNLEIDFDDVNHAETLILADAVAACLNEHFVVPTVWSCPDRHSDTYDNEDCWYTAKTEPGACPGCGASLEPHRAEQS